MTFCFLLTAAGVFGIKILELCNKMKCIAINVCGGIPYIVTRCYCTLFNLCENFKETRMRSVSSCYIMNCEVMKRKIIGTVDENQ